MADLLPAITTDAALNVLVMAGSEGAALGASAAFATAGLFAANSWWNFGISLAVGVVVAVVVDAVVGEACEEEARVRLRGELERLRARASESVGAAVSAAWAEHARRIEDAVAAAVEGSL
jgi:hypothetical protein